MKYGIREICNVVFRAKSRQKIGGIQFEIGQPVLYLDTAKTSTLEGSADTSYANGGRGNNRLMAWEGNKALTFTVEDALISEMGLAILSGANFFKGDQYTGKVHVHQVVIQTADASGEIDLTKIGTICEAAPIFVMESNKDNEICSEPKTVTIEDGKITTGLVAGTKYFIDCYVIKEQDAVAEIQITPDKFAGNFYVEADTLFRDTDGKDYPAIITIPNVKIQSAFSFTMSADGDPSTFTFTMDAFPDYTYFDKDKKVLCVIQVVNDAVTEDITAEPVMDECTEGHKVDSADLDADKKTGFFVDSIIE